MYGPGDNHARSCVVADVSHLRPSMQRCKQCCLSFLLRTAEHACVAGGEAHWRLVLRGTVRIVGPCITAAAAAHQNCQYQRTHNRAQMKCTCLVCMYTDKQMLVQAHSHTYTHSFRSAASESEGPALFTSLPLRLPSPSQPCEHTSHRQRQACLLDHGHSAFYLRCYFVPMKRGKAIVEGRCTSYTVTGLVTGLGVDYC